MAYIDMGKEVMAIEAHYFPYKFIPFRVGFIFELCIPVAIVLDTVSLFLAAPVAWHVMESLHGTAATETSLVQVTFVHSLEFIFGDAICPRETLKQKSYI